MISNIVNAVSDGTKHLIEYAFFGRRAPLARRIINLSTTQQPFGPPQTSTSKKVVAITVLAIIGPLGKAYRKS